MFTRKRDKQYSEEFVPYSHKSRDTTVLKSTLHEKDRSRQIRIGTAVFVSTVR